VPFGIADSTNETSFDAATLLTVLVGQEPNQTRFTIHEGIICGRSEFFRRAMSGDWKEREEREIKLPEDDPQVFATYVNLAYTNKITTIESGALDAAQKFAKECNALCKLYVFSEKLCDTQAKNSTVHALVALSGDTVSYGKTFNPDTGAISVLYAGTLSTSPARQLVSDWWTDTNVDYIQTHSDKLPRDFLVDVLLSGRRNVAKTGRTLVQANVESYLEKEEKAT
jgi:hypothetical protein